MNSTDAEIFLFGAEQMVFSIWLSIACIIGLFCNLRTLYKEYEDLKLQKLIPLRILILIVFATDFFWMFSHTFIYVGQTIKHRILTGFPCYFIPISGVWLASGSCVTMAYIAYERYRLIVKEKMVTMRHMTIWMVIIWSLSFLMGCMPAFYARAEDFGIEITSTGAFCMHKWYDPRPLGRIHSLLCILACSSSICFIAYFYRRVYQKYREVTNNVRDSAATSNEEEREVINKLVTIVYLFVGCWALYLFVMLIQVIVGHPLNSIYEGIATILVYFNPTFNALYYSYPKKQNRPVINIETAPSLSVTVTRPISSPSTKKQHSPSTKNGVQNYIIVQAIKT